MKKKTKDLIIEVLKAIVYILGGYFGGGYVS